MSELRSKPRHFGWIEACLRYAGRFGPVEKVAYAETFDLTDSSVSRHQRDFVTAMNSLCGYRAVLIWKGKIEIGGPKGLPEEPVFAVPTLDRWIEDALRSEVCTVNSVERTTPDPKVLQQVITAIRHKVPARVTYHSRSSGEGQRLLSMHTLVNVVDRYHVRAFDHEKDRFSDFVLARMTLCVPLENMSDQFVTRAQDLDWMTQESVAISVRDGNDVEAVARDFGLDPSGHGLRKTRAALIPYVIDAEAGGYENPVKVSQSR